MNVYHINKEIMRGKSIKQIFEYACQFSRKELIEKHKTWHLIELILVFSRVGQLPIAVQRASHLCGPTLNLKLYLILFPIF